MKSECHLPSLPDWGTQLAVPQGRQDDAACMLPHSDLASLAVVISRLCKAEHGIHLLWAFVASCGQLVQGPSSPESEAVGWVGDKDSRLRDTPGHLRSHGKGGYTQLKNNIYIYFFFSKRTRLLS